MPFIPASLDDSDLTPVQFRVLCHISRRGDCIESAQNMADRCRIHRDSLWDALRALLDRRMLKKSPRPGATSVLTVAPFSDWQPSGKQGPPESKGHPSVSDGGQRKARATTHRKIRATEGNPIKEIPLRVSQKVALPPSINTERLAAKWEEWIAYRQGLKGCKDFDALFKRQAEWLARFGEPTAFEILETSLRNGWQGLFAPSRKTSLPPKPQTIQQHVPGVIDPAQIELPGTL